MTARVQTRKRRGVLLAAAVLLVVLAGVLWVGGPSRETPLHPRSDGPDGTSALVALLRELDAGVTLDVDLPDGDTAVALLLRDRLDESRTAALRSWVRQGGILVVTDPGSSFAPGMGAVDESYVPVSLSERGTSRGAGSCDIGPLRHDDIATIEVFSQELLYDVPSRAQSCFGDGDVAYVVATQAGSGTVVALAGSGIVTNRALDKADNAPVLAALLAPRTDSQVIVLDPSIPGPRGEETLWAAVPTGTKRALAQLAVAFLLYVLWRARRLGSPVAEPQPVAVASSELVMAVGGMLERTGSAQHAADTLRAELRRDLVSRAGLPPGLPSERFVGIIAARSGLDVQRLELALGPGPVRGDAELLKVAQAIDVVRREVFERAGTGTDVRDSFPTRGIDTSAGVDPTTV